MSTPDPELELWKARAAIFEYSYDEVLAAIKHQDDKLNRTLTATAFLTAAAVALFSSRGGDVLFEGSGTSVRLVFFVVFVVSVVFAVASMLAAIGPTAPLSALKRRHKKRGINRPESLLFYRLISTDPKWDTYLEDDETTLYRRLAKNFHDEAKTLSHRNNYKVARSQEASAFVQLAILALALLGIFSSMKFAMDTRWKLASALVLALLVLPLWDVANMHIYQFPVRASRLNYALVALLTLLVGVNLLLGLYGHSQWAAMYSALGGFLATRLAIARRWPATALLTAAIAVAVGVLVA